MMSDITGQLPVFNKNMFIDSSTGYFTYYPYKTEFSYHPRDCTQSMFYKGHHEIGTKKQDALIVCP